MSDKLRALDLFCGAGGVARGLQQAGYHVTGVDIRPQPRYAGDVFIQADALTFPLEGYDLIWASPPCQGYSRTRHLPWIKGKVYPLLIAAMRERLENTSSVWIIENVADAKHDLKAGVMLCGTMFGLKIYRHRLFESNIMLFSPPHQSHQKVIGPGKMLNDRAKPTEDGWVSLISRGGQAAKDAMGIDWMTMRELSEAIPPVYSRYLASQTVG